MTDLHEAMNAPLRDRPTLARLNDEAMLARGLRRITDVPEDGTWAILWPGFYGNSFAAVALHRKWLCEETDLECAAWWMPDPFGDLDPMPYIDPEADQ